ncbi:hypothetical protein CA54_25160 [Symmachiella macrocystis]|uniref:Uncharacterized protein n=1 Tax=Symmachiella macrocystis TaxID=2527985 RepID=A0A5C6BQL7_9PLAN|nr:hypothetical protein [Symmachiella macrocystis]TWU13681.1 hypothetical protein CA54_25160 [Symmachiella macrocystis]
MLRHPVDPKNFSLIQSIDDIARANQLPITENKTQELLLEKLTSSLREHVAHGARLHGFRTQSMFAHVAAAMGECLIIKEEDGGAFFDIAGDLKQPDFRIVTRQHGRMLVEVKNFYQKKPHKKYTIKGKYLHSLKEYAKLNEIPLKIAIYWARWGCWTLLEANRLDVNTPTIEITMDYAFKHNEMSLLGDHMIGTVPPLSLRVYADKDKPRNLSANGKTLFTVKKACVCADDIEVVDPLEERITWFLILNGTWNDIFEYASVTDNLLNYLDMQLRPELPNDEASNQEPFTIIGTMSQMISNQYKLSTSPNGPITSLIPNQQPDEFGILIPHDYVGKTLKLWRLYQQTDSTVSPEVKNKE